MGTFLRRLGNKQRMLPQLLPLFPTNISTFIDLFAGSLAVSLAMRDRAAHIVADDNDHDVSNLSFVWQTQPDALADALAVVPYHEDVLRRFGGRRAVEH